MILGIIIGLAVGFVGGVLVYRKNKKHSEQIINELKNKISEAKVTKN
jgi:hypothetical protein